MSIAIFSLIFRGDIANYAFFKALISTESKNQYFYFCEQSMAVIFDFQNGHHENLIWTIPVLIDVVSQY